VKFTLDEITDEFHMAVDPDSAPLLTITPSTVLWWMGPDLQGARAALLAQSRFPLRNVLNRFTSWVGEDAKTGLWGNGAAADNVWLRSAYNAVGIDFAYPFDHRSDRCYRTIKNLVPDPALYPPDEAVAHDALCDARWQAKHLQAMLKDCGLPLA
jgi:hypothetical protein